MEVFWENGVKMFDSNPSCAASEMVHFRKKIGEKGIELIPLFCIFVDKKGVPLQLYLWRFNGVI